MNVAISDIYLAGDPSGYYNELEKLLNVHLHSINLKQVTSEINRLYEGIGKTTGIQQLGIVIPVDENQNIVKKIWSLIYTARKAREVKNNLTKITKNKFVSYGVYPQLSNPVAIYQLKSPAEEYANQYLLPPVKNGINGFLRRIIFSIVKFHPSTAGIIVIHKIS